MKADDQLMQYAPLDDSESEDEVHSSGSGLPKSIQHVKDIIEDRDVDSVLEKLFHLRRRDTTWRREFVCGFIQFISCMYVLPVVPAQLSRAGFDDTKTVVVTAAVCGIGCLVAGIFANLPFIIAPPTAVSIFYSVFIRQNSGMSPDAASTCVILSGAMLILFGYRPLGRLATKLIPQCIQLGTAVGIGLITALAGATEINLVESGTYTIVDIGKITDEVVLAMLGFIVIAVALYYKVKGAFCITLVLNTMIWWTYKNQWPGSIVDIPMVQYAEPFLSTDYMTQALLVFELFFLCLLTLSGLVRSMSDLCQLTRDDGTTPRNRWLFIMCGLITILSGYFSGPPILISPESTGGIKAGAKTGLSTCVCGVFFCLSTFISPIVREVPNVATAPLLLTVGVILSQNAKRIDWSDIRSAFPAFCCIFFIPFTYNILFGVVVGYIMFLSIGVMTGHFRDDYYHMLSYFEEERKSLYYAKTHRGTMDLGDDNVFLVSDFDFDDFADEPVRMESRQRSRQSGSARGSQSPNSMV